MKTIQCRDHEGGTFQIPSQRGRPPVRCSAQNPCTVSPLTVARAKSPRRTSIERETPPARSTRQATPAQIKRAAERAATEPRMTKAERDAAVLQAAKRRVLQTSTVKAPSSAVVVRTGDTPSVAKAKAARELLAPLGWHCTARVMLPDTDQIELTASRGEELLNIIWRDGELKGQHYSLWNTLKPSANKTPAHSLPFDPDEMPDRGLVDAIRGMKVTWWNRIAKSEETAVVSPDKVAVVHTFNGTSEEVPADRVITFTDYSGSGTRSFRVGALLKIG